MKRDVFVSISFAVLLAFGAFMAPLGTLIGEVEGAPIMVRKDGTGDYTTIQAAVDNANPGDMIIVGPGTYAEKVIISTPSLDLIGSGPMMTMVSPGTGGTAFTVLTHSINITGFNLTGGASGIKVIGGSYVNVSGNFMDRNTNEAVNLVSSTLCNISGNIIYRAGSCGVYLAQSSGNDVNGNAVIESPLGVSTINAPRNDLKGNLIDAGTRWTAGFQIGTGSHYCSMVGNTVTGNGGMGFNITRADGCKLLNNNITSGFFGIEVNNANGIEMTGNVLSGSGNGITLRSTRGAVLFDNILNSTIVLKGEFLPHFNTHRIGSTNTVNGLPVVYLKNQSSMSVEGTMGQLILANCTRVGVGNSSMKSLQIAYSFRNAINKSSIGGLYLYRSNDNMMNDLTNTSEVRLELSDRSILSHLDLGSYGMNLKSSDDNEISNCTLVHDLPYTAGYIDLIDEATGNRFLNNTFVDFAGIRVLSSPWNSFIGNTLVNSFDGIWVSPLSKIPLVYSHNITIERNRIINPHYMGINVYWGNDSIVRSNYIEKNTTLYSNLAVVSDSSRVRFEENHLVSRSERSLVFYKCTDSVMRNNRFESVPTNIQSSFDLDFIGNNISKIDKVGEYYDLWIEFSSNVTMNQNIFHDTSGRILNLNHPLNTTIFDNIFDLTEPWSIEVGGNLDSLRWNISKTPGQNILGGDYLGGNYWSGYSGLDLDGDWLGDTDVPYGPGDMLPLQYDLIDPTLTDLTEGVPATGDNFTIKAQASDERQWVLPYVEYWFDDGPHVDFPLEPGDPWSFDIPIPYDSIPMLSYSLSAIDSSGNTNSTETRTLGTVDNKSPIFAYVSYPNSTGIGENIIVDYAVSDNIGIVDSGIRWKDIDGAETNGSVLPGPHTLPPQDREGRIELYVWAVDGSLNYAEHGPNYIDIVDVLAPRVVILQPLEGDLLRGEVEVIVNVTDLHGTVERMVLSLVGWGSVELLNITPTQSEFTFIMDTGLYIDGNWSLVASAMDDSGNVGTFLVAVSIDNTPPVANAGPDKTIMVGSHATFDGSASSDQNGILSYRWNFTYKGNVISLMGQPPVVQYQFDEPGVYEVILTVWDILGNNDWDMMVLTVIEPPPRPRIVDAFPLDGSVDVPLNSVVRLTFSEPMDVTLFGGTLEIAPIVTYWLTWSENDTVLSISFPDRLAPVTLYTMTIDSALSAEGGVLEPPVFVLDFMTKEAPRIFIDVSIDDGDQFKAGSKVTVFGTSEHIEPGAEVNVTIGDGYFITIIGLDGSWSVQVTMPDETGTYTMTVSADDAEDPVIIVVYTEDDGEGDDDLLKFIGLILIILVLLVLGYIFVKAKRKGPDVPEE